ncbi:hypothetical protein C3Y87_16325 [Carbonactinospora thermoautotrophica]|uniref:TRAP transporter fused permease subunit n=1 Tax=Carbonactinospora thermoautotrophica TaxID=1469144 RepID=UPI00226F3EFB|nr:TRAP transporter fused permease subunit [Carbonactinospora thermoautotrophica]MCX9192952.1 hypothetical protein [Carbonactinospora thermoautotrophica]
MAEITLGAAPDREQQADLIARYEQERPARRLSGRVGLLATTVAVLVSVYALVAVFRPQPVLQYRITFLAAVLPLTFLAYRGRSRRRATEARTGARDTPDVVDWVLALLSVAVLVYPLVTFDEWVQRQTDPTALDVAAGLVLLALVLEATRRTVGPVLPVICLVFLAYGWLGGLIPASWDVGHRGYDVPRLIGSLYIGTDGFFGVPLDVAATYIVLFTVYGAVLDHSGAGKFFVELSLAAFRRSRTAPGRTVTLAGFLLGTVSGSGVATTVSLGSVAWPILRRAGYPKDQAGGVLAAGGIGAILSPPTLGAAAFLIAELLGVSYLKVLLFATVPTILYYVGVLLAIEIDARRFGAREAGYEALPFGRLLLRFGYHFSSLALIVALMAVGRSPFQAVVIATLVAFALSFLDPAHRMTPRRTVSALAQGTLGVLPVTATTAAAGVIVAVVTLTGLGLKASGVIVDLAGHNLALTAVFAALAVLLLGLAVPVTASFIIAAVIIAPAFLATGATQVEAYMFVFYYAVLSEVSPPTALSAVAAAAITGGNAFRTMLMAWRYTLPAFLVPFAFVLTPNGEALLGERPFGQVVLATVVAILAVAALAVVTGGWMFAPAGPVERLLAAGAAVLLLWLEPLPAGLGLALLAAAAAVNLVRRARGVAVARPVAEAATPGWVEALGRRRGLAAALACLAVLGACAVGVAQGSGTTRLSVATGQTTGVYYVYGGRLAQVITENLAGVEATAEATGASVDNIKLVARSDTYLGFTLADTAATAVQGTGKFTEPQPIRALAYLYDNYTQVAVKGGSGIRRLADLRGKRVSLGAPNSGTEVTARRLLQAAGLDPDKDVRGQRLGLNESVQAMKDGTVDAMFWSGGLPTGGIKDLTSADRDVRLLDTTDVLDELRAKYGPVYREVLIPAATYGLPGDVRTVGVPNYLVVNERMNDELAYQLTKLLFDHKADLVRGHPEARKLDPAKAPATEPVPLHPGSLRYYRERGTAS